MAKLCGLSPHSPFVLQCRPDTGLPSRFLDLTSHPHRLPPARMHSTRQPQHPISIPSPARPRTPLPFRSPVALHSYHPNPTYDSSAPQRRLSWTSSPRGGPERRAPERPIPPVGVAHHHDGRFGVAAGDTSRRVGSGATVVGSLQRSAILRRPDRPTTPQCPSRCYLGIIWFMPVGLRQHAAGKCWKTALA